ncbi:MAG: hypothetical protein QXP81_10960 [Nitrososphaerota archaeon]
MTRGASCTKRLNLKVDEWVKNEVKVMAAEINPDRPRIQDVLQVAIMIRKSDPRLWRTYVSRLLAEKSR